MCALMHDNLNLLILQYCSRTVNIKSFLKNNEIAIRYLQKFIFPHFKTTMKTYSFHSINKISKSAFVAR
jgi:hypothetical protein